jgi:hypothetical protein
MQAKHGYCDICGAIQPAEFEPLTVEDTTDRYLGGEVVCRVCGIIVATLSRPKQDEAQLSS